MNATSKALIGAAAVVVIGLVTVSLRSGVFPNPASPVQDPSAPAGASSTVPMPRETGSAAADVALREISASLEADLAAQTVGLGDLDGMIDQNVTAIDAANSSKNPYDETSL